MMDEKASSEAGLQVPLRRLLSDRTSPEAAALYTLLLKYVHRRVISVSRSCGNHLSAPQQEEIASDVLLQLMQGALARFRGETLGELYAYVRTVSDRSTWRAVRRVEREWRLLADSGHELTRAWAADTPRPDRHLELIPDSPLSDKDQQYLMDLLAAGSKADLARAAGVSRAAVTQRVQRIRSRIDALTTEERMAHEVWLRQAARGALAGSEPR